jgi:hypothetical protein
MGELSDNDRKKLFDAKTNVVAAIRLLRDIQPSRACSIAITQAETARLWIEEAISLDTLERGKEALGG